MLTRGAMGRTEPAAVRVGVQNSNRVRRQMSSDGGRTGATVPISASVDEADGGDILLNRVSAPHHALSQES